MVETSKYLRIRGNTRMGFSAQVRESRAVGFKIKNSHTGERNSETHRSIPRHAVTIRVAGSFTLDSCHTWGCNARPLLTKR